MSDVKLQQKSRNLYLSITTYTNKDVAALTRLTPQKISHQKGLNSTLKFERSQKHLWNCPPMASGTPELT